MTTLSIVIPAYNEENGIADIIQRVLSAQAALEQSGTELLELLVVDDGSRDKTYQIASTLTNENPCLHVIRHSKNRGYGGALKTGFNQARGDLIGFLDADGTYPPEFFPQLCQKAREGADIVVGSRMAGATSQMPVTRRIGNVFFAGLLSLLGGRHITDSASGMRVFLRSTLDQMYPLPDGLNLTPVMSTRAVHEGLKIVEVPIPYSERVGRSKLSVVRDGSIFLQSMVWTVLLYNPVRIFGLLGLLGIVLAGLVAIGMLIARLNGIQELGPLGVGALYLALIAGTVGVSLFSLGATFNYLVSIFYKRPVRQGMFGKPIFKQPLEQHFGWLGLLSGLVGIVVAIVVTVLGVRGWEITRLWFYFLASAMLILIGVQMLISWLVMKVLAELSIRDATVQEEMGGGLGA